MLLEMYKIVLDRRCKSFGSSDRTGVGGCGSQSGSNITLDDSKMHADNKLHNEFLSRKSVTTFALRHLSCGFRVHLDSIQLKNYAGFSTPDSVRGKHSYLAYRRSDPETSWPPFFGESNQIIYLLSSSEINTC